jgi:diketogulonate reductase-like aldo/keto reductase
MTAPMLTLNDGHPLPWIGFGTYPLRGPAGQASVRTALDTGFRLLDAAANYRNEVEVGRAVREFLDETRTPRDEVFVQTKVPGGRHTYGDAIEACEDSLALLGLDRIDVIVLHAPDPTTDAYRDAWRALVDLRARGVVRSLGVSNVTTQQLTAIVADSGVVPAIGQIEANPYSQQGPMRSEFARLGIVTQSWRPLGGENPALAEPAVVAAAAAHGVTPAQVVLRWHLQQGSIPLPMSPAFARQRDYLNVFGFALTDAELAGISALGRDVP